MRKILVIVIFLVFAVGVYTLPTLFEAPEEDKLFIRDELDDLDRDFWFVGEWETMFPIYEEVKIKNGIVNLETNETDRGPFMLSKPIEISQGDVFSVKRRVNIHYGNDHFTGGFALIQTDETSVRPEVLDQSEGMNFGEGIVLVEYVHDYNTEAERPGRDIFRVLPATWQASHNYAVIEPIFDEWFEEELILDTRQYKVTYKLNGVEYKVDTLPMDKPYLRVFMHGYGWYTGHNVKVDWVEFKIEDKSEAIDR